MRKLSLIVASVLCLAAGSAIAAPADVCLAPGFTDVLNNCRCPYGLTLQNQRAIEATYHACVGEFHNQDDGGGAPGVTVTVAISPPDEFHLPPDIGHDPNPPGSGGNPCGGNCGVGLGNGGGNGTGNEGGGNGPGDHGHQPDSNPGKGH